MGLSAPSLAQLASGLSADILEKLGAALRAQDILNVGVTRLLNAIELDGTPWERPQYIAANLWADSSADRYTEYRKDWSGIVWLQLNMTGGTLGATAFALPEPFWPRQRINTPVSANGAYGTLIIALNGEVSLFNGSTTNARATLAFQAARR